MIMIRGLQKNSMKSYNRLKQNLESAKSAGLLTDEEYQKKMKLLKEKFEIK